MIGPLCACCQVFQNTVRLSPALALTERVLVLADLWQLMSALPNEAGSTKPLSWFKAFQPAVGGAMFWALYLSEHQNSLVTVHRVM